MWKSCSCVKCIFLQEIFEQLVKGDLRTVCLGGASFDNKNYCSGISFLRIPLLLHLTWFWYFSVISLIKRLFTKHNNKTKKVTIIILLKRCDRGIFYTLSSLDLCCHNNAMFFAYFFCSHVLIIIMFTIILFFKCM